MTQESEELDDSNLSSQDNILLWIVVGIACLFSILAFLNSIKRNKHYHPTNESDNKVNYQWINSQLENLRKDCVTSFSNAEKRFQKLEDFVSNQQKLVQQQPTSQRPTSQQPQAPVAPAPPQISILYVEPDSQKPDVLFKQTTTLSDRHLYEIHLDSSEATQGELHIRRGLSADYSKKYIDGRNDYLKLCEILSSTATASRIEMKKPGRVVKDQNEWKVIIQPTVELV